MNHMRRKGTIVSPPRAQTMLDSYFGIDEIKDTPAGKTYNKNGAWRLTDDDDVVLEQEQCVAYFLPENLEAVLFINSKIGAQNYSLRGLVQDAYVGSLV